MKARRSISSINYSSPHSAGDAITADAGKFNAEAKPESSGRGDQEPISLRLGVLGIVVCPGDRSGWRSRRRRGASK
jgi:hypothetical protein